MAQTSPQKETLIQSLTNILQQKGVFNKCVSRHLREIASQIESNPVKKSTFKKRNNENQASREAAVDFIASYLDKNHLFEQLTNEETNDPTLLQTIAEELSNAIEKDSNGPSNPDPFNDFFQIIENRISPKGESNEFNTKSKNAKKVTKVKKKAPSKEISTAKKDESQYDLLKPIIIKKAIRPNLDPDSARANSPIRYTFGLKSPNSKNQSVFSEKKEKQHATSRSIAKNGSLHNKHRKSYSNYTNNPLSSSRVNENGVIEVTPQPIYISRKKLSEGGNKPHVVNLQYEIKVSREPLPGTPGKLDEPSVIVSPRKRIEYNKNKYNDDFSTESSSSPEIIKEEILAYIPSQTQLQETPKEIQSPKSNLSYYGNEYNRSNNNYGSINSNNNYNNNDNGANNYHKSFEIKENNNDDSTIRKVKLVKRRKVLKNPEVYSTYDSKNITERSFNSTANELYSYSTSTTQTTSNVATQTTEDSPTRLKISVIEAETKGTSDGEAYGCIVQVNDQEKRTSFNRSRKPQWRKNMTFMVPNIFSDELMIKVIEKTDDDDQYIISSLTIPLKKVALDDEINEWFDMESDISKQNGGRIHLKMSAASIDYSPN